MGKAYRSDDIIIEKSVGMYETRSNDTYEQLPCFWLFEQAQGACQSETQGCLQSDERDNPCKLQIKHHYFIV
jgi:hypothetical protein